MSRQLNPAQIWSQMPLANRTSTVIKSIQYGTITLAGVASNTATITTVSTTKSVLHFLGNTATSTSGETFMTKLSLTNATTITADRTNASATSVIGFCIAEYY